jgi:hypothetical protein
MNECYIELSIPFYPLVKPVEEFLDNWPEERMDKLIDISYINPIVVEYFNSYEIKVRENFILWKWTTKPKQPRLPHTDGDWRSMGSFRKRDCGINWNFTPRTRVEFYSKEGAIPTFNDRSVYDFSTDWENCNQIVDIWNTPGPVLFNPQIPHDIKSDDDITQRLSLTLRFYETFESIREKLNV